MHHIEIENGITLKCPQCNSIFAIENDSEILYRNITLIYFDTKKSRFEAKCRSCKRWIALNLSDMGGKIAVIE